MYIHIDAQYVQINMCKLTICKYMSANGTRVRRNTICKVVTVYACMDA